MDDQRPARPRVRVTAQMRGAGAADLSNATGNRRSCPSFVNRRLLSPDLGRQGSSSGGLRMVHAGLGPLSAEAPGVGDDQEMAMQRHSILVGKCYRDAFGATYRIVVANGGSGPMKLTIDGKAIEGNVVPYAAPGTTVNVECRTS